MSGLKQKLGARRWALGVRIDDCCPRETKGKKVSRGDISGWRLGCKEKEGVGEKDKIDNGGCGAYK